MCRPLLCLPRSLMWLFHPLLLSGDSAHLRASCPDPVDRGVGVILKQVLWTGMDHEEHRYFTNLSARNSAACEPRSCACGVQPEFTLARRSLDLSDAGLPSMCSCKCRKRRDGDRPAQEALGSSCQEGPPATFQPEPPGPCFPHGMVAGPREGGRRDLCLPCGAGSHGEAVGDASAWCPTFGCCPEPQCGGDRRWGF